MEAKQAQAQENRQEEDPQLKQQMLTLTSLQNKTLTYKELFQILKVQNAEQLEELILKAISGKVIKARIDQVEERVIIEQGISQTPDWQNLKSQVSEYKSKLSNLLESLENNVSF